MKKIYTFLILFCSIHQYIIAQNQNISNGIIFDGEPYLIIHPKNPKHLVVAWMGYAAGEIGIKTKVSVDGGMNWSKTVVLPHLSSSFHSADPSMVFDNQGKLYTCYIDYKQNPDSGGIYIISSSDGGYTWGTPVKALDAYADGNKRPLDRPWLTINPVNNHLYITSKPAPWIAGPNRAYFIASTDNGQSWSSWKYIDAPGYLIGNFIDAPMSVSAVAKDGTLHILYPSWVTSQNILPGFIHASSTDDGKNFIYNGGFYSNKGSNGDTLAKVGYRLIADPTDEKHLVFTMVMKNTNDMDIYIVESKDGGLNWNPFQKVNDDAANNNIMQDLPWADFNSHGDLVVAWRDRRNGTGTGYASASEIYGAVKWKDSINFTLNFKLSDSLATYNAKFLEANGNDFMNVLMTNDTIYSVWGDVRNGKLNIWFARKVMGKSGSNGLSLLVDEDISPVHLYPNPSNDYIQWSGVTASAITIYSTDGKELLNKNLTNKEQRIFIGNLNPGIYILKLQHSNGESSLRWVKE